MHVSYLEEIKNLWEKCHSTLKDFPGGDSNTLNKAIFIYFWKFHRMNVSSDAHDNRIFL